MASNQYFQSFLTHVTLKTPISDTKINKDLVTIAQTNLKIIASVGAVALFNAVHYESVAVDPPVEGSNSKCPVDVGAAVYPPQPAHARTHAWTQPGTHHLAL